LVRNRSCVFGIPHIPAGRGVTLVLEGQHSRLWGSFAPGPRSPKETTTMTLYHLSAPQLEKMLKNIGRWMDKAAEHAKNKKFEPNVFLTSRLAPDQHPFKSQIQIACDNAKFIVARLTGKEAPSHPDTEQTFEELRARITNVTEFVASFKPADFEGAEKRLVALPFMPGKVLTATDYLSEFALPNFYFHAVTAYAILRHNGVELGKPDYIGSLNLRDA
jgi:uncharacterized protein